MGVLFLTLAEPENRVVRRGAARRGKMTGVVTLDRVRGESKGGNAGKGVFHVIANS